MTLREKIRFLVKAKIAENSEGSHGTWGPKNAYQLWKLVTKRKPESPVPQRTVYNFLAGKDIPLEHLEQIMDAVGLVVEVQPRYTDDAWKKIIKSL